MGEVLCVLETPGVWAILAAGPREIHGSRKATHFRLSSQGMSLRAESLTCNLGEEGGRKSVKKDLPIISLYSPVM